MSTSFFARPLRRCVTWLPCLLVLVLAGGCGNPGSEGGRVIARFGGEVLTSTDLTASLLAMSRDEQVEFLTPVGRRTLVEILIDRRLAAREARRLGLEPAPDAGPRVAQAPEQERALQDAWMQQQLAQASAAASEDDLRAYFEEHAQVFTRPARIHVERILFPDRNSAMLAVPELRRGTGFAAYRDSREPSPIQVDTLWLQPRDGAGELERAALALADGAVSEPIGAVSGFYMLRVMAREGTHVPEFDEVRAQVANRVEAQQRAGSLEALRSRLRQGITIEIDAEALQGYACDRCATHENRGPAQE